jgi:hypothetical protein
LRVWNFLGNFAASATVKMDVNRFYKTYRMCVLFKKIIRSEKRTTLQKICDIKKKPDSRMIESENIPQMFGPEK